MKQWQFHNCHLFTKHTQIDRIILNVPKWPLSSWWIQCSTKCPHRESNWRSSGSTSSDGTLQLSSITSGTAVPSSVQTSWVSTSLPCSLRWRSYLLFELLTSQQHLQSSSTATPSLSCCPKNADRTVIFSFCSSSLQNLLGHSDHIVNFLGRHMQNLCNVILPLQILSNYMKYN